MTPAPDTSAEGGGKQPAAAANISPTDASNVAEVEEAFPFQGYVEGAENRAIIFTQLQAVSSYALQRCSGWTDYVGKPLVTSTVNLYDVNTWVIRPGTESRDCAFVERLTSTVQQPKYFISHWWGEAIMHFLECVALHLSTRGFLAEESAYWICAYANRQWSLGDEITANPKHTSFFKAMCLAHGLLIILDGENAQTRSGPATPFTRIWCAFELSMCVLDLRKPIDIAATDSSGRSGILTDGLVAREAKVEKRRPGWGSRAKVHRESAFPIELLEVGLGVRLEIAKASVDTDRVHILNSIAGVAALDDEPMTSHDNYERVNKRLKAAFSISGWYQAMVRGTDMKRYAEILAADVWRKNLVMQFSFCEEMDDENLQILASGIPPNLHHLELHFWMCPSIGDVGMLALSLKFPQSLETLILNCQMCLSMSSVAASLIGTSLPPDLRCLRLNFEFCKRMANGDGFRTLLTSLAGLTKLRVLDLNFAVIDLVMDRELVELANALPTKLKHLHLDFKGCLNVCDAGASAIMQKLPRTLSTLSLILGDCWCLTDECLEALAANMPPNLMSVHLDLTDCRKITDAGVAALLPQFPGSLVGAKVLLDGTGVSDEKRLLCRNISNIRKEVPAPLDVAPSVSADGGVHLAAESVFSHSKSQAHLSLRSIGILVSAVASAPLTSTGHDMRSTAAEKLPSLSPSRSAPHLRQLRTDISPTLPSAAWATSSEGMFSRMSWTKSTLSHARPGPKAQWIP